MKKVLGLIVFVSFVASLANAQGFRGVPWGADKEQVMAKENFTFVSENDDTILFRGELVNLDTYVAYIVLPTTNQLVRGAYIFVEEYLNENNYIDDYNKLKGILIERYGPPVADEVIW